MRHPDITGVAQAWQVRLDQGALQKPDHAATMTAWLIHGPFHPAWSWWSISLVHLHDLPDVPPAKRHYPEAEFELIIMALNPEHPVDLEGLEAGTGTLHWLQPLDLVYQFHGVTDNYAICAVRHMVEAICRGEISPDQDFRAVWMKRLDAMFPRHVGI